MQIDRRTFGVWKYAFIGWLGAVGILFLPRLVFGPATPADVGTARVLIPTFTAAAAMALVCWMAVLAFRGLDEFHKEASKFAWYWGGSIGIAVSAVAYVFIGQGGMHWLDPAHYHLGHELFRAYVWGYLTGVGGPLVGFIAARIWWQAAKR